MPTHEPTHLPEMSVPLTAAGAGGAGFTGAGIAVAAGAGALVGGGDTEAGGVDVPVEVGESVTVASAGDVAPAGTPVLSVAPATVSVGGVSARDAGGSDELKTEHAASRGIMASTSSTRIEPPLTLRSHLPVARRVPDSKR
ncbi:MAG: hypothetical protein DMD75_01115 [Candidatus Rokuibacteriota bacterium]|nr:MAG: hypothetical protein DMD75_01115 [Candidatus Rokubacteria bacterium]